MRKEYDLKKMKLKLNPYVKKPSLRKALIKVDGLSTDSFGKKEGNIRNLPELKKK